MQLAVRLSVVPWAMLYMSSKLQCIVCIAFYFLFYECTHFFSVCTRCYSSRDHSNNMVSIADVPTKAHLISMVAVPAVVTQNCACISAGCYRFCSSAISVMLLSLRLIPRLWQLGLSFKCWFQWWFRTTFILFDMVLLWDLITKLLVRRVFIVLQIRDGRGTWQRKIIQHLHDSCEENIVCEQRQSSQKPENFCCYIQDVCKWQVVSSATSGILTGNDSFRIGKKWPGERNGKQKAKETLQAGTDILNSLKS